MNGQRTMEYAIVPCETHLLLNNNRYYMDGQPTMAYVVVETKHDLISGICALILRPTTIKKNKKV